MHSGKPKRTYQRRKMSRYATKKEIRRLERIDPSYAFLWKTIEEEARRQEKAKRENPELYAELVRTQFPRIKAKLRKKKKESGIKYTAIDV